MRPGPRVAERHGLQARVVDPGPARDPVLGRRHARQRRFQRREAVPVVVRRVNLHLLLVHKQRQSGVLLEVRPVHPLDYCKHVCRRGAEQRQRRKGGAVDGQQHLLVTRRRRLEHVRNVVGNVGVIDGLHPVPLVVVLHHKDRRLRPGHRRWQNHHVAAPARKITAAGKVRSRLLVSRHRHQRHHQHEDHRQPTRTRACPPHFSSPFL
mmetsp:Transcript_11558/g.32448  ORF Transcript_11558/g.32448 Transcript_11558/m.32448 type:complete len:208 (-) Transcript_11558:191-814(-)